MTQYVCLSRDRGRCKDLIVETYYREGINGSLVPDESFSYERIMVSTEEVLGTP